MGAVPGRSTRSLERMTSQRRYMVAAAAAGATVSIARADIGVPMAALFLPPMWVAIVPVIVLESLVVYRLAGVPFGRALLALAVANLVSTVVGVPLAWFVLALGEMLCCAGALGLTTPLTRVYAVTLQAPWLIPYESDLGWMIPFALVTLGVIFAALSVVIETPIASRILRVPVRPMWRRMAWANVASYLLLAIFGWALVVSNAKLEPLYNVFAPLSNLLVEGVFGAGSWLLK
jgi:hypothetical protein